MDTTGVKPAQTQLTRTAAKEEIDRFASVAEAWWDLDGAFGALHRLNPLRVAYVRDRVAETAGVPIDPDTSSARPLAGLNILDVGCGGGLISEPLTRLGARVTGIDADAEGVGIARAHAALSGLEIDYEVATPEDLAERGQVYDAVVSMEVVEHVTDVDAFLQALAHLARPGGSVVLGTLNRTLKSLALAKIGAEYVLRWVPPGTHSWRKFVRPAELAAGLRRAGTAVVDARGMTYEPLGGHWSLSTDLSVNYLMAARKSETASDASRHVA